jgi:hypothetical protein
MVDIWHKRALSCIEGWSICPVQFTVATPQHFLYFFPEPHRHGSFRPTNSLQRTGQGKAQEFVSVYEAFDLDWIASLLGRVPCLSEQIMRSL